MCPLKRDTEVWLSNSISVFQDAVSAQAKMRELTPEEMREILKQKGGVDVDQNDADPMGDGDQRPLQGAQADETR